MYARRRFQKESLFQQLSLCESFPKHINLGIIKVKSINLIHKVRIYYLLHFHSYQRRHSKLQFRLQPTKLSASIIKYLVNISKINLNVIVSASAEIRTPFADFTFCVENCYITHISTLQLRLILLLKHKIIIMAYF